MSDEKEVSRRSLLMKIGILLNAAVALLIATPVVGYLLAPIRKNGGYDSWIDLGDFSQFPLGQTRLASFVNPKSMPWYGGCRTRSSRYSPSIAPTLAARCAGSRNRNSLCARAMAASITRMARAPRAHHREAFSSTTTRCKTGN